MPWRRQRHGLGLLVWLVAWALMLGLDPWIDLANQALVLVLAAARAGLWWSARASAVACLLAVLAFNRTFVPPRATFSVDLAASPGRVDRRRGRAPGPADRQHAAAGMARWREHLLSRGSSGIADFFRLPDNAVVELGTRVQI